MYQILLDILGFTGDIVSAHQTAVIYCCVAIVTISFVVLLDLLYRIFRHFWR